MSVPAGGERGQLALVLHSHMPYVEGFGTWPFGEEWLWEAVATVYLPLLRVLRGAPVTIGLTPVLCDQLETMSGPAGRRFVRFLEEVRSAIHAEDAAGLERAGEPGLATELRRAAGDYADARAAFDATGGDPLSALGGLGAGAAELWTGPATHAVLPLTATRAGLDLQLGTGIASHERRFGWSGGLWLPECAYEPGLEAVLADHGVRAFCVDQTDALGLGSLDHLQPIATEAGPVAVPIDWETIALVWDEEHGYPAHGGYRDHHRRTLHDLKPWSNGGPPYDHEAAIALARAHARDFVERAARRLELYRADRGRPGLLCCALDSELLGHWWYEGPLWLAGVLDEAARQGLSLVSLPAGLDAVEPVERELAPSTWGKPKDLSTWDSPRVADLALGARDAELRAVSAARSAADGVAAPALARAARELLMIQSSDWAFMATRDSAGDYPRARVAEHRDALDAAILALRDSAAAPAPELRGLAPDLDIAALTAP